GYKIKDLIHSTQEEDLKILGINRKDANYSLKEDFGREDIKAERLARMTLRALDEGVNPDAVTEGSAEFQSVQGLDSGAGEQYSLKDAESVRDVVLETIPKLDESNKGDKNARVAAMKAIGGNLSKLRQAMGLPRHCVPLPLIKRENWVGVDDRC
ncbi:MAG: hypothetical protein II786_00100, partial [Muribaculaceae bacterium]|nr:hypothetical protein [Muribaculaceae bacterium]